MTTVMRVCVVLGLVGISTGQVWGQGSKRTTVLTTKALDMQAEKVQNDYLSSLADLAGKYEESGDIEKSIEMLKSILKIKPDAEVVKNKLKQFQDAAFSGNLHTVEVEAGAGWASAGVSVTKDKPIRIEAEGTYKFAATDILGPAGYPAGDGVRDMARGVPCGALMAMVAKAGADGRNARPGPKDSPRVEFVGAQQEITPTESGTLLLRINIPDSAAAKCNGKIRVKITGHFSPGL